jgi:hypothetical protein
MRWARHVVHKGKIRNASKILVGKPEGMNHFGEVGGDRKLTMKRV